MTTNNHNSDLTYQSTEPLSSPLLLAVLNKNLSDVIQEMGHNQTAAIIILAKHQKELDQAIINLTRNLLTEHVPSGSIELYLDTVTGRFGLDGQPRLSLQKIGNKWDMSRERIRQVESSILRLLKMPHNQEKYLHTITEIVSPR